MRAKHATHTDYTYEHITFVLLLTSIKRFLNLDALTVSALRRLALAKRTSTA